MVAFTSIIFFSACITESFCVFIINLVKEFRIYRTKNEREQLIKNAVANKIDVEERIEKTILKINTQNDSVMHAEKKIIEVKATIND